MNSASNLSIKFGIKFSIINLVSNLILNLQVSRFGTNLPKEGISGLNQKSKHPHWILYLRNNVGTRFHFKQTVLKFGTKIGLKKYFPSKTEWKNEHLHYILHIEINLGTKFKLKLTICFCVLKFPKKSNVGQKQKKWTPP